MLILHSTNTLKRGSIWRPGAAFAIVCDDAEIGRIDINGAPEQDGAARISLRERSFECRIHITGKKRWTPTPCTTPIGMASQCCLADQRACSGLGRELISHPGSAKPLANQFRHLPKASRRASALCGRVITMAAYQLAKSHLACCHRVLASNRMAQRIADEVKACLLLVCGLSLPQASTSNWAACIAC